MPIDEEQITRAFRVPLRNQVAAMVLVLERIARWLGGRVKQAETLERASRAYPAVRFYNEGLCLQITSDQYGAIAQEGSELEGPFAGIRRQWDQENAIPLFLERLSDALLAIERSVKRFTPPTEEIFKGKRTASDLFGIAGLAFSRAHDGRAQLRAFAEGVVAFKTALSSKKDDNKKGDQTAGSRTPEVETSLADDFDGLAGALMGAILVLPVLPALIGEYLKDASLRTQIMVLDLGNDIEKAVYGLRDNVRGLFHTDFLQNTAWMFEVLNLIGDFTKKVITGWFDAGIVLLTRWIDNWVEFADGLKRVFNFWIPLVATIVAALGPLAPMISEGALGYFLYERPEAFFDAYKRAGKAAWKAMKDDARTLYDWSRAAYRGRVWGPPNATELARQNLALKRLGEALEYKPPAIRMGTSAPAGNVKMQLSGTLMWMGDSFVRRLDKVTEGIPPAVKQVLDAVDLESLAAPFDRRELVGGEADLVRRLTAGATATAEELFGTEARDLQKRLAEQAVDPVAQAMEGWLIGGGIDVVGKAIPVYAMELDRWWRDRRRKETDAERAGGVSGLTSPRILAERIRLRGVKLKELTIRARSRALDEDLAVLLAAEVRENVSAAYRNGFQKIERERPGRERKHKTRRN